MPLAASCLLLAIGACTDESGAESELDLATCEAPELFRIDRVALPHSTTEARQLGLDLNGDRAPDNELGMVMSALMTLAPPLDATAATADRLAGEVTWRLALRRCDERVVVSLGREGVLDEVQLVGAAGSEKLVARGAGAELPLSLMFDPDNAVPEPGWISGVAAAIELERSADGAQLSVRLGMALDPAVVLDVAAPPVARFFDAHRTEEAFAVGHLDRDHDGRVSEAEVRESSVASSLLAPDLRLDGVPLLSLGIGLSAHRL